MLPQLESHCGHTFLRFGAQTKPFIIDCGAHKGEFTRKLHQRFGATGHSIEASPLLFELLEIPTDFERHEFAVSGSDGEVAFTLSSNPEYSRISGMDGDEDIETVTIKEKSLSGFLSQFYSTKIDLLKLDIEGAEIVALESLSDLQLARIAQISVEFHDFCGQVSAAQVNKAICRLRHLGFRVYCFSFFTRGDVLFVNQLLLPIGPIENALIHLARLTSGLRRRVKWSK